MESDHAFSASQVKTFSWCELQYWFQYVSEYESYEPTGEALRFGNAVHESIEKTLRGGLRDLDTRLEAHFMSNAATYDLPNERIQEGRGCMEVAASYISDNLTGNFQIEEWIEYDVNRSDFSGRVNSKIDIVTDGEIWDWKTGSDHEDQWIQAAVYAAAYASRYGDIPSAVRFIYLSKPEEVGEIYVEPAKEDWEEVIEQFNKIREARESGEYEADPSRCFWCPYELFCSESEVGYGQISEEVYP